MARLVEVLVKELKEWPEDITKFTCDPNGEIRGAPMTRHDFYPATSVDRNERTKDLAGLGDDLPFVDRAQWQAERDRQKGGEWKRHRGGKQPVVDGTHCEYRYRDGTTLQGCNPELSNWSHYGATTDIMAFRVISQPQAEEVEVKDTTIGTISYKISVDQIAGPLCWRDTIIHCQAIIEDCEREIERNVELLDAEGLMIQTNTKTAMQYYAPNVEPKDWQIGDILEITRKCRDNSHDFKIGEHVKIDGFDLGDEDLPVKCNALDDSDYWYIKFDEAKFISRP